MAGLPDRITRSIRASQPSGKGRPPSITRQVIAPDCGRSADGARHRVVDDAKTHACLAPGSDNLRIVECAIVGHLGAALNVVGVHCAASVRRRERKMPNFKAPGLGQRFLSIHYAVHSTLKNPAPPYLPSHAPPLQSQCKSCTAASNHGCMSELCLAPPAQITVTLLMGLSPALLSGRPVRQPSRHFPRYSSWMDHLIKVRP
jgi:hypothetical protein